MTMPRALLIAIAATGSACAVSSAAAQQAPAQPKTATEAARIAFGGPPPAGDIQVSDQNVDTADILFIVDECMKLSPQKPSYWPTLKADGWALESGKDDPAQYAWEGVFIRAGHRGKLVEHIWQGDILHCEARGETGSAARRSQIWDALVAHYSLVPASEFKGRNGFIENVKAEKPEALRGLYVSAQNFIISHSDEKEESTLISVDVF